MSSRDLPPRLPEPAFGDQDGPLHAPGISSARLPEGAPTPEILSADEVSEIRGHMGNWRRDMIEEQQPYGDLYEDHVRLIASHEALRRAASPRVSGPEATKLLDALEEQIHAVPFLYSSYRAARTAIFDALTGSPKSQKAPK